MIRYAYMEALCEVNLGVFCADVMTNGQSTTTGRTDEKMTIGTDDGTDGRTEEDGRRDGRPGGLRRRTRTRGRMMDR